MTTSPLTPQRVPPEETRDLLRVTGLRKTYGATVALAGIEFSCRAGEVHALIGENGSGKSTLVKILSGVTRPAAGRLELDHTPVSLPTPAAAMRAGVSTVFQELSLIKGLSVAENLLLTREPLTTTRVVSKRELRSAAEALLDEWEAGDLPADVDVGLLSLAQQQRLEIVRALSRRSKVLLLDEPTSALGPADVDWLKRQLPRLRAQSVAVVFISHRLGEVKEFSDRISILRNGQNAGTFAIGEVSDVEIIERMIGRTLAEEYRKEAATTSTAGEEIARLETRSLRLSAKGAPIDLRLRPGEILGVAGLEGQGQKRFFNVLFGVDEAQSGAVVVDGKELPPGNVVGAVGAGVGYVPEERRYEGLFLELPVKANLSMVSLRRFSRFGFLRRGAELAAGKAMLQQLNVAQERLISDVGELSGGNQQKIVLAKWLLRGCKVLLLFDPTRGVDVGAKAEIFELMRRFADGGGAIVFYSSDLDELETIPDSVAVFYRDSVVTRVPRAEATQSGLMRAMLGLAGEQRVA